VRESQCNLERKLYTALQNAGATVPSGRILIRTHACTFWQQFPRHKATPRRSSAICLGLIGSPGRKLIGDKKRSP